MLNRNPKTDLYRYIAALQLVAIVAVFAGVGAFSREALVLRVRMPPTPAAIEQSQHLAGWPSRRKNRTRRNSRSRKLRYARLHSAFCVHYQFESRTSHFRSPSILNSRFSILNSQFCISYIHRSSFIVPRSAFCVLGSLRTASVGPANSCQHLTRRRSLARG